MNAFLTPALVLPIMRACIESPVTFPISPADPRVVLSLVCHAWADIINSCPDFWNSYVIYPVLLTNVVQQMNTFNLFVSRSQSRLLSFNFVSSPTGYDVFGMGQLSIMNSIIRPHANRICLLKCLLVGNDIAEFFRFLNTGVFQSLEACHIQFFNGNTLAPIVMQRSNSVPFPRLTAATFNLCNGIFPSDLKLPLSQLTTLALAEIPMTPSAFVHIARFSQSLVTASFSIKFDVGSKALSVLYKQLKLTLPSLDTLRLRLINPNYYPTFIHVLRLPNLHSLWIERAENIWPFDWNVRQYATFLRLAGVGPSLESFAMTQVHYDTARPLVQLHGNFSLRRTSYQEVQKLLRAVPNLTFLHLPLRVDVHTRTLQDIGQGALLPRLTTLSLTCRTDARAVLDMVMMRNGVHASSSAMHDTPSPLTKIVLIVPATGSPDLDEELRSEVKALGLGQCFDLRFMLPCTVCSYNCGLGK